MSSDIFEIVKKCDFYEIIRLSFGKIRDIIIVFNLDWKGNLNIMKKVFSLILALVLALSLTACGSNKGGETSNGEISEIADKSAFTMVKFEVNPAFYLFFDESEKAIDFEPLNEDARTLSFDDIKGLSISEATKAVLSQMLQKSFLKDGEIKITVLTDNSTEPTYETLVKGQIEQFAQDNGLNIVVTVFPATDDVKTAFDQKKNEILLGVEESQISSETSSSETNTTSSQTGNLTSSKETTSSNAASSSSASSSTPYTGPVNAIGNTAANINNGAYIAIQGDWVYYILKHELYRMKTDGSEKHKVCDDIPVIGGSINVVGDWIYCRADSGSNVSLYRIKIDGSKKQRLNNDDSRCIHVVGDWIYYFVPSPDDIEFQLYRIKTDGSGRQKLSGHYKMQGDLVVVDDWIYYNGIEGFEHALYRMKIDGSNKQKLYNLSDRRASRLNVVDDWIYFCRESRICRIKIDGSGLQNLSDDGTTLSLNVMDDWIYYKNMRDGNKLYRMKTDGSNNQKLADITGYVHVFRDWIFVYVFASDTIYCMKPDGTQQRKLVG